jgi:hypothetical protein
VSKPTTLLLLLPLVLVVLGLESLPSGDEDSEATTTCGTSADVVIVVVVVVGVVSHGWSIPTAGPSAPHVSQRRSLDPPARGGTVHTGSKGRAFAAANARCLGRAPTRLFHDDFNHNRPPSRPLLSGVAVAARNV